MKPAPFEYHAPETVDDAVALLAEHGDDAKPLAGGQSLVPMLALRLTRFAHLVDLNRVAELDGRRARRTARSTIGAMTRQRAIERDARGRGGGAAPRHWRRRSSGTSRSATAARSAARSRTPTPRRSCPAVALAARRRARARQRPRGHAAGRRGRLLRRHVDDGRRPTTSCSWPRASRCGRAAAASRSTRSPAATATSRWPASRARVELGGDGKLTRAAIAFLGMGPTPVRARDAEAELLGGTRAGRGRRSTEIAQLAVRDLDPTDDVHASARYRDQRRRAPRRTHSRPSAGGGHAMAERSSTTSR